jgi:hypothetical protein
VADRVGHANIQNTTIYARLTNPAGDVQARTLCFQSISSKRRRKEGNVIVDDKCSMQRASQAT